MNSTSSSKSEINGLGRALTQSSDKLDEIGSLKKLLDDDPDDKWTWSEDAPKDAIGAFLFGITMFIGASGKIIQQMLISALLGRRDTVLLAAVSTAGIWTGWTDEVVKQTMGQISVLCAQATGAGNEAL